MKLSIVLGVALVATLASVSAKPSSSSVGDCTKEDEGVSYGVPSDCRQYIVCKKGKLQVKQCESKYNYDTVAAKCVKAKDATCAVEAVPEDPEPVYPEPEEPQETNEQYDYLCVKVLYGVRIHPNACDKYLVCTKEKATIEQCADGFIFVADAIECVKGNKVSCTVERDEPSTTEAPTEAPTTEPKEKESEESNESKPGSGESDSGEKSKEGDSGEGDSGEGDSGEGDSGEDSKESDGKYDYLCAKKLLGSVAHPESCTKYISCKKYKAKEESCKKGYSYSSKFGLCLKQNNGQCADAPQEPPATEAPTEPPKPITKPPKPESGESDSGEDSKESEGKYDYLCAKKLLGSVAHPESCTKYISCKKYKAKEESCKKGYTYSSKFGLCLKQNNGQCTDAPQEPPATEAPTEPPKPITKPPKPESGESDSGEDSKESEGKYDYLCAKKLLGSVAHPESCTKYISCKKYKAKEESCKKGYTYSSKFGLCLKQNNGQCTDAPQEPPATEAPTEPPKPITKPPKPESGESDSGEDSKESEGKYDYLCAKKLLGSVAHPESCTKYISCKKYKAKEESCKKGYTYSSKFGLCLKQNNGQCTDAPQEPPATEAPTEPPKPITKPPKPESGESDSGEDSKESEGKYDYLCAKKLLGSVAHPESCTKYISCKKYKAKEENCKKGYSYSSKFGLCVKQNNGQCADAPQEPPATESPTEAPTKPDSGESGESSGETGNETPGKYDYLCENVFVGKCAHPETCTKYIYCKKNKAEEKNCKKGSYYSVYLQTCIKGNSETCAQGNGNGGSSTSEPTTVTEAPTTEAPTTEVPTEAPTTEVPTTEAPTTVTEPPTTEAPTTEEPTTVYEVPTTEESIPELTPPGTGGDPMEPTVECVEGFTGYVPIESDCTKYVYCFQGEPGERTCIDDYIYYHPFKACLPGDPVSCQLYNV